jgi:ABC-type multidrug transport system fused ATPase/permease subunit
VVTQDVQLFGGTVRENLTFFDSDGAGGATLGTLDALGLASWARGLPAGWTQSLRPMVAGCRRARRNCWLRAVFLRDPGLIILDEASSRSTRHRGAARSRHRRRLVGTAPA